jgi:hypothetical protein
VQKFVPHRMKSGHRRFILRGASPQRATAAPEVLRNVLFLHTISSTKGEHRAFA